MGDMKALGFILFKFWIQKDNCRIVLFEVEWWPNSGALLDLDFDGEAISLQLFFLRPTWIYFSPFGIL